MDAGHPGKTEAQTPRPVPGSILLHAGKDDAGALDAYLHAYNPAFSEYSWAVDIRRKGGDLGQDMLGEEPYLTMCSMAMAGKVALVGAAGPPPVRGRAEQTLWGSEDLEPRVMEDTDNDSVLMLRQMYLTSLAYKGLGQLTVPQVGSSFLFPGAPDGPDGVTFLSTIGMTCVATTGRTPGEKSSTPVTSAGTRSR